MPEVTQRVRDLHARMTLEEKLAQLVGYWVDQGGNVVAPLQGEMENAQGSVTLPEITQHGIGHYTRVYGTRPVDPVARAEWLWYEQRRLKRETRLGIPALVHEECLTGLAAWKAATFPTPLAWGAAFDPDLVEEMGGLIGDSMLDLGIHQGLAPVMDVVRDPRWGRVEECIGEDPYLVGTIGTSYVRGLQGSGVHATLKHFVAYSASQAGRNHAPVSAGQREISDIFLPPFEMAVLDGSARSVMASYNDVDGVPMHSSREYLTDLLRGRWGFDGVVVADYFGIAFLHVMHAMAGDRAAAAAAALEAGVDIELPSGDAYLEPLASFVTDGTVPMESVDQAVLRALDQKESLGLLDPDAYEDAPPASVDLDSAAHRDVARRLAQESVVLLSNDGVLPFGSGNKPARVAVVGPNAHRSEALVGCYSFTNHVLAHFPDVPTGLEMPSVAEALTRELSEVFGSSAPEITCVQGCDVDSSDTSGFPEAVAAAESADIAVVVVGDQAGMFGRGTVGEGNDSESLDLPGVQRELVEAVLATGTPVVMVLLTGRPYAVPWALPEVAGDVVPSDGTKPHAVLQVFFPGEEGGPALARVLSGRVNPSGRLPVSLPRSAGAQPYSYLHPILGGASEVTSVDPAPVRPFGFGLSYTTFERTLVAVDRTVDTKGLFRAVVQVTNTGEVTGDDVVQLYGHDMVASVARPVAQLLGYHRVTVEPGESVTLTFTVPVNRFAFTNRSMVRIVEPGDVEVWVGAHAADGVIAVVAEGIADLDEPNDASLPPDITTTVRQRVTITGDVREVRNWDARWVRVSEAR